MRGLIARILTGQAPTPAENLDHMRRLKLAHDLDVALAKRARDRRPAPCEAKRFAHARPMVERLRLAITAAPRP